MPTARTPETPPHLDARLGQLGPLRQLLAGVDVRVVRPLEGLLQLLQLFGSECGPASALLALQGEVRFRLHVRALIQPVPYSQARERERAGPGEMEGCSAPTFRLLRGTEDQIPPEHKEKDAPHSAVYQRAGWEATPMPSPRGLVKCFMVQPCFLKNPLQLDI